MYKPIENEYTPDYRSSPHETILEAMEARNQTKEDILLQMAPILSCDQTEALLRGELAITEEIALKLEHIFGVPATFWNKREKNYRDSLCK